MRCQAKDRGRLNLKYTEDDVKTKSWLNDLSPELWDQIAEKANFSSEYPKGTPTTPRHVTYAAYLNKIVETIRLSSKSRFRTDTEIFRVALHHGVVFLYHSFCIHQNCLKSSRGHFFYKALEDLNAKMERATMISIIEEKTAELISHVKRGSIKEYEASEELTKLFDALPDGDKEYIKSFFAKPSGDNVKNINYRLLSNIINL